MWTNNLIREAAAMLDSRLQTTLEFVNEKKKKSEPLMYSSQSVLSQHTGKNKIFVGQIFFDTNSKWLSESSNTLSQISTEQSIGSHKVKRQTCIFCKTKVSCLRSFRNTHSKHAPRSYDSDRAGILNWVLFHVFLQLNGYIDTKLGQKCGKIHNGIHPD